MTTTAQWVFGSFRFDPVNACVWQGPHATRLTPTACALLQCLLEHAGQVVTKEALFAAVWPDVVVSENTLKTYIWRLRQAFGDAPRNPQFLETVHRLGYRFTAPVSVLDSAAAVLARAPESGHQVERERLTGLSRVAPAPWIVGRDVELHQLQRAFAHALGGQRQVVFVTGEPGIGKTTLVETFVASLAGQDHLWIAQGQAVEHYGTREAYQPLFEIFSQLARRPAGARLLAVLRRYAPLWLVQMPWLLAVDDQATLQGRIQGRSREQMLREVVEALEALTADMPLVLILEDLHWSDYATLDVLVALAQRREPARLLVVGTYRPQEVARADHPLHRLTRELQRQGWSTEIPVSLLSPGAVEAYLMARLPGAAPHARLAPWLHRHTEGHPLFLVTALEAWVQQGLLAEVAGQWVFQADLERLELGLPTRVQALLERQLHDLDEAQRAALGAGSVAGAAFSAAAAAAGLGVPVEEVEAQCAALARGQYMLRAAGDVVWPDGTTASGYAFLHTLHRAVVYQELTVTRRRHLHQRIGERLEQGYGETAAEMAAELAMHFERGGDLGRAIRYREHAAQTALRRYAYREAIAHLHQGLALLQRLPETPAHLQQALILQTMLGSALIITQGYGSPEVQQAYDRVYELCQQVGETAPRLDALQGLWTFSYRRSANQRAHALGQQLLELAQRHADPAILLHAHLQLGVTCRVLGEMGRARTHLEEGIGFYYQHRQTPWPPHAEQEPGVLGLAHLAWVLWYLGYPEQGLRRGREALALAQELGHPYSLAMALIYLAVCHCLRREAPRVQHLTEAALALARAHDYPHWYGMSRVIHGWALVMLGQPEAGLAELHAGLAARQALGTSTSPFAFLLLVEVYATMGQAEAGLRVLAETQAAAQHLQEHWVEPELYRVKGELLLGLSRQGSQVRRQPLESETEACLRTALDLARRQHAKALELRAAMRLSQLWQTWGRHAEARQLLAEIHGWFTEGFATPDLRQAKALLTATRRRVPATLPSGCPALTRAL